MHNSKMIIIKTQLHNLVKEITVQCLLIEFITLRKFI